VTLQQCLEPHPADLLHPPPPDSSLAPDIPAWSDSKTGQITRYKLRTRHELTTSAIATRGRLDAEERRSHFGYKAHIALDEGSEIIRAALLTAADLHDSQPAAAICSDEQAVYGDKTYASQALRAKLAAGIGNRLMY
jgi:IS5 family transposase